MKFEIEASIIRQSEEGPYAIVHIRWVDGPLRGLVDTVTVNHIGDDDALLTEEEFLVFVREHNKTLEQARAKFAWLQGTIYQQFEI